MRSKVQRSLILSGLYFVKFITMVFADTLESGLKKFSPLFCASSSNGLQIITEYAENPIKSRNFSK